MKGNLGKSNYLNIFEIRIKYLKFFIRYTNPSNVYYYYNHSLIAIDSYRIRRKVRIFLDKNDIPLMKKY
jgi:hypothetical protein